MKRREASPSTRRAAPSLRWSDESDAQPPLLSSESDTSDTQPPPPINSQLDEPNETKVPAEPVGVKEDEKVAQADKGGNGSLTKLEVQHKPRDAATKSTPAPSCVRYQVGPGHVLRLVTQLSSRVDDQEKNSSW